jgi:RNA polymerase sigma factor (sigma-70 family)
MGSGSQRLYSFEDLIELKLIKKLLDAGISLQRVREAIDYLRTLGSDLSEVTLVSDGTSIFACYSDQEVVDVLRRGQSVFGIAIGPVIDGLRESISQSALAEIAELARPPIADNEEDEQQSWDVVPLATSSRSQASQRGVDALVAAAAGGEDAAWSELVDHFSGLVWSVIRGYRMSATDAAEVSQTTWLRLAEHIHKVREPERIGAWVATTAGRECLRMIHQNQRAVPSEDVFLTEVPDTDPAAAPGHPLLTLERYGELWEAFSELPEKAQVLLRLLFADPPPSYEEISAATGMPIGSIGPTRGRYLAQLKERMAGHFVTVGVGEGWERGR